MSLIELSYINKRNSPYNELSECEAVISMINIIVVEAGCLLYTIVRGNGPIISIMFFAVWWEPERM